MVSAECFDDAGASAADRVGVLDALGIGAGAVDFGWAAAFEIGDAGTAGVELECVGVGCAG